MSVVCLDHRPIHAQGTLVCLPGVNSGAYVFAQALETLGHGWRILRLNVPGVDGVPLELPFSPKSYARHAWHVLDNMGIRDRVMVLGHSMGGFAAQEMVRMAPERVSKAVFVSTCRGQPDMAADLALMQQKLGKSFWQISQDIDKDPAGAMRVLFGQRFVSASPAAYAEFIRQRDQFLPSITARLAHLSAGGTFSSVGWVHRLEVPCLVVHGTEDILVRPESGKKLAQSLPEARFLELYGVGHFPMLEHPNFWEHVADFLGGVPMGVQVPATESRMWRRVKDFLFRAG